MICIWESILIHKVIINGITLKFKILHKIKSNSIYVILQNNHHYTIKECVLIYFQNLNMKKEIYIGYKMDKILPIL